MANKYKLVIVESPAKARTISRYLGRTYHVIASQGHVRDLPKSQIGVDVENNFEPKYITIRGRGDILDGIRKEAKNATQILLATDPDREGEAISWHLASILKIPESSPCRVEFHEITSREIKSAIKKSRPVDMDLVDAQQARRVLDRLVGYKISPILWAKVGKGLSAGRVQSVAASIIVDREREIEAFEPEEYWTVSTEFTSGGVSFKTRFFGLNGEKTELRCREDAQRVQDLLAKETFTVSSVKRSERKKYPAPPFTTSNLQQEASRKLGFTTARTMQIAQQLYEGVDIKGEGTQGLVSYIRTDSTRVSDLAIDAVRMEIMRSYGLAFLPEKPNEFKTRKSAQDAHEAIRPTDAARRPEQIRDSLTRDQYRLYKLIWDRFTASQMTPAVYDTLTAEINGQSASFRFGGQKKRFAGFTAVYEEVLDDQQGDMDTAMPDLIDGAQAVPGETESEQHFTQPPPRFTEASLVRALEEKGIGRPSTYAPTISTIINRGYIARENKRLYPTELGTVVTGIMKKNFPDIVDEAFTADLEEKLDEVEAGREDWHRLIADFYGPFEETLKTAEEAIEKVQLEEKVSDVPCDKCGTMMVYRMGRYGKFLACPNFPECRNTMAIQKDIGVPCPDCGGRILEKVSRKGRKFYGCERYPDCTFVSWDLPVAEKCPDCGGRMVYKRGRKGEGYRVCVNESCRKRVQIADGEVTEHE